MAILQSEKYKRIHTESLREFGEVESTLRDERRQCLEDRRFYTIAGAMWEGKLGEQFENKLKLEMNKIQLSIARIFSEYRNNRIGVDTDFRCKKGDGGPNAENLYQWNPDSITITEDVTGSQWLPMSTWLHERILVTFPQSFPEFSPAPADAIKQPLPKGLAPVTRVYPVKVDLRAVQEQMAELQRTVDAAMTNPDTPKWVMAAISVVLVSMLGIKTAEVLAGGALALEPATVVGGIALVVAIATPQPWSTSPSTAPQVRPMCRGPVGLAETNSTFTFRGRTTEIRPQSAGAPRTRRGNLEDPCALGPQRPKGVSCLEIACDSHGAGAQNLRIPVELPTGHGKRFQGWPTGDAPRILSPGEGCQSESGVDCGASRRRSG
jgi:hypothetical protein